MNYNCLSKLKHYSTQAPARGFCRRDLNCVTEGYLWAYLSSELSKLLKIVLPRREDLSLSDHFSSFDPVDNGGRGNERFEVKQWPRDLLYEPMVLFDKIVELL